tara:strand:+ start:1277 stop:1387 length:111 start_codon:yes stop_codon:yes gene_type:complete
MFWFVIPGLFSKKWLKGAIGTSQYFSVLAEVENILS